MQKQKMIGKREFIQHTSKYIKWVEVEGAQLIITHHNHPELILAKIKPKQLKDLSKLIKIKIHGDVNEPVFPGFDEW